MNEFHCLDIELPDVDFSPYYIKSKIEIDKVHHPVGVSVPLMLTNTYGHYNP
ncbi:hypothetical protein [Gelidibacter gilvus]|uniref:hypothetical protein n=1 Tax=Gelidibacter gilvus TaxID=59602 RepID=UPI00167DF2F7|nr:hypothetical protein [Gelidibacter gilvus]